jgi:hypothetical protein
VCLGVVGIAVVFICTAKILFQRKVRQARYIADKAIEGETDVDEHDIWLAIDILQVEYERRKLSGREETEDGARMYKLADIWQQRGKPKDEQKQ